MCKLILHGIQLQHFSMYFCLFSQMESLNSPIWLLARIMNYEKMITTIAMVGDRIDPVGAAEEDAITSIF